ncbi:MAG: sensor histidine kinase [Gammaproteobacteria bacterium]|nr:sensor histidine kinase [Gammaproteobacteria bacterium]MBU1556194.1 sensor histidine kinase [Gammaproteobacteria bacterium]MBU2071515.1 sensor histidine kinase [Gammaproteobacteria bacterium]MBU2184006.1 sensor histidine kinase [Gammaproteobacteria bacterium]MBU2206908.1 sensor histidine kinase [Gammaproteobacteria bacterium]
MYTAAFSRAKSKFTPIIDNQLPLLAALLLEAAIRHFSLHSQSTAVYWLIWLQLLLESAPLLLAHYVSCRYAGSNNGKAALIWVAGFLAYPVLLFSLADAVPSFAGWSLFSGQGWLLLLCGSAGYGLSRALARRSATARSQLFSKLFSLDAVLLLLMLIWAVLWAGIFASTEDPVRNQPIKAVINSESVIVNFGMFLMYLWQFLLIGSTVLLLCWVNRYWLICKLLARTGVFAYVAGCLISIIVLTPLLASLVLALPMNIAEFTFLPSQDHNIFASDNYRFCFVVLLLSAPVILAFERQQQETALAEVAQRHSATELQLLQQQVNPHFLFNTLNNLYALTLANSAQAPNMVMQLANLLRYTVYDGQAPRVTLAQEVQYLQDFLALQSIRSADKCQLSLTWPEHAERWQIAPLLLIIVLENAFKHGVEPSQSGCHVVLKLTVEHGWLHMHCSNSVPDGLNKSTAGVGLDNLRRRLSLLYAGKHHFSTTRQAGNWCVELTLELEPC